MIKLLHGKHYYMEFLTLKDVHKCMKFIKEENALKNEKFGWHRTPNRKTYFVVSVAKCGEFRGEKMIAWEHVKSKMYRLRKEEKDL